MTKIYLPDNIEDFCVACVPVGSRVTCNPPPMNTDQDVLCLLADVDALVDFEERLIKFEWEEESEKYGTLSSNFYSWRKDVPMSSDPIPELVEYNLILTYKEEWFDKFLRATVACKKANAMTKKERVAIFDEIMGPKNVKKQTLWQQLINDIQPMHHYNIQAQNAQTMWAAQQNMNAQGLGNLQAYPYNGQANIVWADEVVSVPGAFQW